MPASVYRWMTVPLLVLAVTACGWFGDEPAHRSGSAAGGTPVSPSPAGDEDEGQWRGWEFPPRVAADRNVGWVDAVAVDGRRVAVRMGMAVHSGRRAKLATRPKPWTLADDVGNEYELHAWQRREEPSITEGEVATGWVVFDGPLASEASELTFAFAFYPEFEVDGLLTSAGGGASELSADELAEVPERSEWEVEALPATELVASEPVTAEEHEVREILAGLDAEVVDDGVMVTFPNDVLFAFDEADLTGRGRDLIADMATAVAHYAGDDVFVYGHTDAVGEADYNQALSHDRAQAVAGELVEAHGVQAGRITVEGFGETQPVAPNETADGADNPDGRALNRRVEVLIATDDERLVDVDSADAQAAGEAGGVTVEVSGVSLGRFTVELDVVMRNDTDERVQLAPDSPSGRDAPVLRDDAGGEYVYSAEIEEDDRGRYKAALAVPSASEVEATLVFFGHVAEAAEAFELVFNEGGRRTWPDAVGELTVAGVTVPDRDEPADRPDSENGESPASAPATRADSEVVRRAEVALAARDQQSVLAVREVRSYRRHTEIDVAFAHRSLRERNQVLNFNHRVGGVTLTDDLGNVHQVVPPAGDSVTISLPAARINTGTLVFSGPLAHQAETLTLRVNDDVSSDRLAQRAPRLEIDGIDLPRQGAQATGQ